MEGQKGNEAPRRKFRPQASPLAFRLLQCEPGRPVHELWEPRSAGDAASCMMWFLISLTAYHSIMNINGKVAVVTGASGGVGLAVATELARRGAEAVALVDRNEQVEQVALSLNELFDRPVAVPMVGDVTDDAFRQSVFDLITARHGTPSICVPAAGSTLDQVCRQGRCPDRLCGDLSGGELPAVAGGPPGRAGLLGAGDARAARRTAEAPGTRAAGSRGRGSRGLSSSSAPPRRRGASARSPTRPPRPDSRESRRHSPARRWSTACGAP